MGIMYGVCGWINISNYWVEKLKYLDFNSEKRKSFVYVGSSWEFDFVLEKFCF